MRRIPDSLSHDLIFSTGLVFSLSLTLSFTRTHKAGQCLSFANSLEGAQKTSPPYSKILVIGLDSSMKLRSSRTGSRNVWESKSTLSSCWRMISRVFDSLLSH